VRIKDKRLHFQLHVFNFDHTEGYLRGGKIETAFPLGVPDIDRTYAYI
jgi:hypothetical protein